MPKTKRLTVFTSDEMYHAVKIACAVAGVTVNKAITELLEAKFGVRAEPPKRAQRDHRGRFLKGTPMQAAE